jgi:hypothetical protein
MASEIVALALWVSVALILLVRARLQAARKPGDVFAQLQPMLIPMLWIGLGAWVFLFIAVLEQGGV